jgi:hypothetical protein
MASARYSVLPLAIAVLTMIPSTHRPVRRQKTAPSKRFD